MNSALAELLHPLTSAALQPSSCSPSVVGAADSIKSCSDDVRQAGRVLSSMTFGHHRFRFKQKTARPVSGQARRFFENGVVLCISCESVSRIAVVPAQRELHQIRLLHSRFFKFVKYTKTLLVRNRHFS